MVRIVLKPIKNIIERSIIDILITQLHDISHSWLSAGISIKSGGLNPMLNHTVKVFHDKKRVIRNHNSKDRQYTAQKIEHKDNK
jgi:hypothetical protein